MAPDQIVVSLPIADRPAAFAFYRDGLGLDAIGDLADDGIPEPLQFALGTGVTLMLVPTGGFGWVLGDRPPAPAGTSECLLSLAVPDAAGVDAVQARAVTAGATVVTAAADQPWGYATTFADPDGHLWMVTAEPS